MLELHPFEERLLVLQVRVIDVESLRPNLHVLWVKLLLHIILFEETTSLLRVYGGADVFVGF